MTNAANRPLLLAAVLTASCIAGCGDSGSPPLGPPYEPVEFSSALGAGLSNPKQIVASADESVLLVLERGAGRLARVDPASGSISRIVADAGSYVALVPEPGGNTALALAGMVHDVPQGESFYAPAVTDGSIERIDLKTGARTPVLTGLDAEGLFLDQAGRTVVTKGVGPSDPYKRIDLATGHEEAFPGCTEVPPEAVDADSAVVYFNHTWYGSPNTGNLRYVRACDLTQPDPTLAEGDFNQVSWPVTMSFGCGSLWEAVNYGVYDSNDSSIIHWYRYERHDLTSGEYQPLEIARGGEAPLSATPGPLALNSDCSRAWYGSPVGVNEYDLVAGAERQLVSGLGRVRTLASDEEAGTVLVGGVDGGGLGVVRLDLGDGQVVDLSDAIASAKQVPTTMAALPHSRRVSMGYYNQGYNRVTTKIVRLAFIDDLDLTTGVVHAGPRRDDVVLQQLAACGEPAQVFASGRFERSSQISVLARYENEQFVPVQLPRALESVSSDPNNDIWGRDLVLTSDCSTAYLRVDDRIYRLTDGFRHADVLPVSGSPMALNRSETELYVVTVGEIVGVSTPGFHRRTIADHLPSNINGLTVTADGKIVFIGDSSTGLGVIDPVAATGHRLWEGYGSIGRWFWDGYVE